MRDDNEEQPFHPIYNYALITDSREGLILTNVNTLADGVGGLMQLWHPRQTGTLERPRPPHRYAERDPSAPA